MNEKYKIDEAVRVTNSLNAMDEEHILLVCAMLSNNNKAILEKFCQRNYAYGLFQQQIQNNQINKNVIDKIVDIIVSSCYENDCKEEIYSQILNKYKEIVISMS